MSKKRKILSMVLVALLLCPMLSAFGVSAETPTHVAYADAKLGDLLYAADFSGTTGVWEPGAETETINSEHGWKGFDEVKQEGPRAIFTKTTGNAHSAWGGDLTTYPLDTGYSYTIKFTVTRTEDTPITLLIDGINGYNFYATKIRRRRNGSSKDSDIKLSTMTDVPGTAPSAETPSVQEFALEIDGTAQTFSVWVKTTEGVYKKLADAKPENDDANLFNRDGSREDAKVLGLFFYSYWLTDVTVSNLNVYKGLTLTYPPYADAKDGQLLYEVNWKGDDIFTPETGAATSYDTMVAEASEDGKSVSIVAPKRDNNKGRAVYGGALNTDLYKTPGNAYTFEFTVTAEDADQFVGFYPDWGTGFIVYPGEDAFGIGQWGAYGKIHGKDYYLGSGSLTQTYAVEYSVSGTEKNANGFYKVNSYSLFVKNGDVWSLVYSASPDKATKEATDYASELDSFQWTDVDCETVIRFFRSPAESVKTQNKDITVSDVKVYKGMVHTAEQEVPGTPAEGGIDINGFEDGELVYKADFAGDNNFAVGALAGLPTLTLTPDATDSTKAVLSMGEDDGALHFVGGEIKGLALNDTNSYTVIVKVTRDKATSETDPFFGISVDGLYYMVGDSSGIQITKGGIGKVRSAVKYADVGGALFSVAGDHGVDYAATTEPFPQTLAIEIDGPEHATRAIRVYALTEDGDFQLMSNTDSSSNVEFMNDNLSVYFMQKDTNTPVTIESLEVYKGRIVEAYNEEVMNPQGGDDEPGNEPSGENENKPSDKKEDEKKPSDKSENKTEEKKGCGSTVVSTAAVVTLVTLGSCVTVVSRKKKNDDAE